MKARGVWAGALTHCFFLTNVFCASFFLPIYFQAVRGASPMMSGVYVLASILSQLLAVPPTGKLETAVQRTGYVIPFAIAAAIIGAISNGLYSTSSPSTSTSQWIGYQILNGVGRGVGMPLAVIAVQASLNHADIAMGNSIVMFAQSLGTAILLAVSDTLFEGGLESELPKHAPLVDSSAVMAAGATHFRDIVSAQDLPGVLVAYSLAIDRVFYLAAGISGLAVFTSLFLGWVNIRHPQRPENDAILLRDLGAQGGN
ncbi:hypothetical protein NEMBOFW57_008767 [Staphylotrichum longicolle]|uniref:Uncharacterized protein n=1 Tax=Staphylotrichum longicolle TaxID=669026 RepID=A0AAD4HWX8_9PEZI|nr:hypothetical protein NEMBOFW57_008767 [Staphylotrichum longicolle]